MAETYYLQRVEINQGVTMEDLVSEWPILFIEMGFVIHFHTLMKIGLINEC